MKKANRKLTPKEVTDVEVEELEETEVSEEVETEPVEEKKRFWTPKKILVGLGVLGGVAIAALSAFGVSKATEVPYSLDSADWYDDDEDDDESSDSDDGDDSDGSDDVEVTNF